MDDNDPEVEEKEQQALAFIESELSKTPARYAAVMIEPLVQGAGGMQMCRPQFLQALQRLVRKHETLIIYDEVMTCFGRTGDWFACRKSDTEPDIICLSKGLTGGFLPLAVTICSDKIYQTFYSDDVHKTLFHGHSYTANPLGCAAALASLELLEANQSSFIEMEKRHRTHLATHTGIADHACIHNLRFCGTIVAMDFITQDQEGYFNKIGAQLSAYLLNEGVLVRPLGNILYILPPYCITEEQLSTVYKALQKFIDNHL